MLDRIEQSFTLFFTPELKNLALPLVIFYTFWLIVTQLFFVFYFWVVLRDFKVDKNTDLFALLSSPQIDILLVLGMTYLILYLLSYIPFELATVKSVQQLIAWEKIQPQENFRWGVAKIYDYCVLYYYIFLYMLGIPSALFILWGLIYLVDALSHIGKLGTLWIVWLFISWVGAVLACYFMVARGTRVSFSLFHAVEKNNFEKQEFSSSVELTYGQWWRVLWNFFVSGIIMSLLSGVFTWVINMIWWIGSPDYLSMIKSLHDSSGSIDFSSYGQFDIFAFISSCLSYILKAFTLCFVTLFSYIFYLRMSLEKNANANLQTLPATIDIWN